ncbi:MAG: NAD-dependent epimerase/dehydratase family protein [Spirochaetales bacterium]|nr:NAD-dependent epimerase/dehydratase family protein [Spirochaetales bacterium]
MKDRIEIDKKPKIAVLGGAGFIGSHLSEYLSASGYEVTVFGRNSPQNRVREKPDLNYVYGDFLNSEDIHSVIEKADVVFHLIGSTLPDSSEKNHLYDVETNLIPTIELIRLCKEYKVSQIVFASSGGTVYGIPESLPISESHTTLPICSYGIVKLAIEHYLRLESRTGSISCTVLRISNPFGTRQPIQKHQGVIGTFVHDMIEGKSLKVWGDGTVVRDYIHIKDVVRAMKLVIGNAPGFTLYNLGSGVGRSVNDIIHAIETVTEKKMAVDYLPGRAVDVPVNILNTTEFCRNFPWKCEVDFHQGIIELINWYRGEK